MMEKEIRIALVGPNTRVISCALHRLAHCLIYAAVTQLIQSTRSTDFILFRQVHALETPMAVHPKQGND